MKTFQLTFGATFLIERDSTIRRTKLQRGKANVKTNEKERNHIVLPLQGEGH